MAELFGENHRERLSNIFRYLTPKTSKHLRWGVLRKYLTANPVNTRRRFNVYKTSIQRRRRRIDD